MYEQMRDNQEVAPDLDVGKLHSDLMVTNERLKAQQLTLEQILAKLGALELNLQNFAMSKAVLDTQLAYEKKRVDELEKTVEAINEAYGALKAQWKLVWWVLGGPVGVLVLAAFREYFNAGGKP